LHFDNGSYGSDLRADTIVLELTKHANSLIRFESLYITKKANDDSLNVLIRLLAPRLRFFRCKVGTLKINDEFEFLAALDPRKIETLDIPAFQLSSVHQLFKSNNFPNLTSLAISEAESNFDGYDSNNESTDSDRVPETEDIRPILTTIAAKFHRLETFKIAATYFSDEEGMIFDAIKAIAVANSRTLKSLDFAASKNYREFSTCSATSNILDQILGGAVRDSSEWHMLPELVESKFGVDISRFRVLGASMWQVVIQCAFVQSRTPPPVEHISALFHAVYPRDKTSVATRIKAFELFLEPKISDIVEYSCLVRAPCCDEWSAWIASEILSEIRGVDIRSIDLHPLMIGLAGAVNFHNGSHLHDGVLWESLMELASFVDPNQPLMACFKLVERSFSFEGCLETSYLCEVLIKRRGVHNIDLLFPVGTCDDPFILFLRGNDFMEFRGLVSHRDLFDPVRLHPTRRVPMLLFAFLEPASSSTIPHCEIAPFMLEMFKAHEGAWKGVKYTPAEHIREFLRLPKVAPELRTMLLSLLDP
jgi:hypothetical protein